MTSRSGSRGTTAARQARKESAAQERERSFELNDAQYDFVYDDDAKFTAYIGGLGAGKSFAGAVKALRYSSENPGSLGVIGAPNYPQLRDSTMRTVFEVFPRKLRAEFNKTTGLLTLANGAEILFRSMAEPDNLRGPNLAWFWLDEGPLCGYYAWQVMKGRLRQAGYDVRAWITGTPHGEDEFYEDFEHEPKPDHRLYRASTRDNAHNLPQHYIEDLGYTGQFALQEIEGLFVAFEGLVYDLRTEWHIGEWPDMTKRPRLAIGGVDWGFTNPAVALPIWIDGEDRAYVMDEFYQRQAGFTGKSPTVGEDGHSKAILDFTRQYGIQTWYCGPDEPGHISDLNAMFGRLRINARAVAANDDIVEGIATVRRYMALRPNDNTSGYHQSARCANLRAEMRTYSYPTHNGAKRDPQEKPIKKFDHACFVAGTLVETERGPLPIEMIRAGDRVWTRDGLRGVIAAGMTVQSADVMVVDFDNGQSLQGTPNHPIWIQEVGWQPLSELMPCDTLYTWQQTRSVSTASSSGVIPTLMDDLSGYTTRPDTTIVSQALVAYTKKCGKRRMAPSPRGIISIIEMAIPSTMRWKISNACQEQSTSHWKPESQNPQSSALASARTLRIFARRRAHGIAHRKDENGIVSMRSSRSATSTLSELASNAVNRLMTEVTEDLGGSVRMPARRHGDEHPEWITNPGHVSGATRISSPIVSTSEATAPVRVLRVRSMPKRVAVYNLTVAGTPEYFANGVLVHNCDATRYALHSALGSLTRHRDLTADQERKLIQRAPVSDIGGIKIKRRKF